MRKKKRSTSASKNLAWASCCLSCVSVSLTSYFSVLMQPSRILEGTRLHQLRQMGACLQVFRWLHRSCLFCSWSACSAVHRIPV
jgi:hypothetical protein